MQNILFFLRKCTSRKANGGKVRRRRPSACERLPAEVWGCIFAWSCTDGGETGRSLALTSRYIRSVSMSNKHRSVALRGHTQVTRFAAFLDNQETPDALRHVCYLFIDVDPAATFIRGPVSQSVIAKDIRTIITRISSSLVHLTIIARGADMGDMVPSPLPALTELTLDIFHLNVWPEGFLDLPPTYPNFPSLTRLHLINEPAQDAPYIVRALPRLTHLRLSGLYRWTIGGRVEFALYQLSSSRSGIPLDPRYSDPRAGLYAQLFGRLDQIVLQAEQRRRPLRWGVEDPTERRELLSSLKHFAQNIDTLCVLEEPAHLDEAAGGHLYRQWLERIVGGPGCWMKLSVNASSGIAS